MSNNPFRLRAFSYSDGYDAAYTVEIRGSVELYAGTRTSFTLYYGNDEHGAYEMYDSVAPKAVVHSPLWKDVLETAEIILARHINNRIPRLAKAKRIGKERLAVMKASPAAPQQMKLF